MGRIVSFISYGLFFMLIGLASCNTPELIGDDLVDGNSIPVNTLDSFTIKMQTFKGSDLVVYQRPVIEPLNNICGILEDDVFGKTETAFYLQLRPVFPNPKVDNLVVDSVVLALEYDTAAFYGDFKAVQSVSVHRITETLGDGPYNQDVTFSIGNQIGERTDFIPVVDEPTRIIRPTDGTERDTVLLIPHLRIPIDKEIGEEILGLDSAVLANDSAFMNIFNGVYVKPEGISNTLLGFNTRIFSPIVEPTRVSGMTIYYHGIVDDTSTVYREFRITVTGSANPQNYFLDYTGALIEESLDSLSEDSLQFIQGFNGTEVDLDIPYIRSLENVLVNRADLEINIAAPNDYDYDTYDPVFFIRSAHVISGGDIDNTDEYNLIAAGGTPGIFGGVVIEEIQGDTLVTGLKYIFNISQTLQKMIDGDVSTKLRLLTTTKLNYPERVILYSQRSPARPANLKVTFTENN